MAIPRRYFGIHAAVTTFVCQYIEDCCVYDYWEEDIWVAIPRYCCSTIPGGNAYFTRSNVRFEGGITATPAFPSAVIISLLVTPLPLFVSFILFVHFTLCLHTFVAFISAICCTPLSGISYRSNILLPLWVITWVLSFSSSLFIQSIRYTSFAFTYIFAFLDTRFHFLFIYIVFRCWNFCVYSITFLAFSFALFVVFAFLPFTAIPFVH